MTGLLLGVGLLFALLVLAYLAGPQGERAVEQFFVLLGGVLATLVEGLRRALSASAAFWREHFGPAFGIRPLLGGLLLVGASALLTWTDFSLLQMTLASLLPGTEGSQRVADLTAGAVIALEFLLGFFAFEFLGMTDFMGWDRRIPSGVRRGLAAGCLILLLGLALAQAGLAAWRTKKLQEADRAAAEVELVLQDEGAGPTIVEAPSSWLDRLPVPVVALLSFLGPLAAAAAAVGLYPVLVGAVGIGVAVACLFPLVLMLGVATVALHLVGYAQNLVQALLAIPQGFRRAPRGAPQPVSQAQAPGDGPDRGTSGDGRDSDHGLEAIVDALHTNPFGVEDEWLDGLRDGDSLHGLGRAGR